MSYIIGNTNIANLAESFTGFSIDKKFIKSAFVALLFALISLPQMYAQTSVFTSATSDSCPTTEGRLLHTAIFFALNYFILKLIINTKCFNFEQMTDVELVKYAFVNTLLFYALSSSDLYKITNRIIPGIANEAGCPDIKGIVVHSIVFLVILILISYVPKE